MPWILLLWACAGGGKADRAPADDTGGTDPTGVTDSGDTDSGDTDSGDTDTIPLIDEALAEACGDYEPSPAETAGEDLWKVTIDDPTARCNDGTPAVMYIRPSTGGDYQNRWVIYLQGGSACTDLESCVVRYCGLDRYTKAKMSSNWTPDSAGESALLARDGENPFGEANQVLLHYCSSDSWTGTKADAVLTDEENYPGEAVRLHFQGREIVRAAIETLLAGPVTSDLGDATVPSLADAELLVFSGSSAGGRGAEHNLDWVADQLPGTEVYGWFDAFMPPLYEDMGEYGPLLEAYDRDVRWPEVYVDRYGLWLEESCAADHPPEEQWLCGNNEHLVMHHVTTPFFVRQDLRDGVTGARYMEMGATRTQLAEVWERSLARIPGILGTAEEADALTMAPGVYAPNCGQHVGLNDEAWFDEALVRDDDPEETWYTHRNAFLAWLAGRSISVLDTEPSAFSVCAETDDDGG